MSTNIPPRNRQLAMQAKLSITDDGLGQLIQDWLLGHEFFDVYDPTERAQLMLDIQKLNGLTGMGTNDWHVTGAALASGLEETDANCFLKWIRSDLIENKYGDEFHTIREAVVHCDGVAEADYGFYAACSVEELLDARDRMVCTKEWL